MDCREKESVIKELKEKVVRLSNLVRQMEAQMTEMRRQEKLQVRSTYCSVIVYSSLQFHLSFLLILFLHYKFPEKINYCFPMEVFGSISMPPLTPCPILIKLLVSMTFEDCDSTFCNK